MITKKEALYIRLTGYLLFLLYLVLLTYFLFFSERYGRKDPGEFIRYNLVPLREIRRFWEMREVLGWRVSALNLAGNVAAFIPFGALLPVLIKWFRRFWRILLAGALMSLLVETMQLVTHVGSFDVDDIILNTLGAALGYAVFAVCNRIRIRMERERDRRAVGEENRAKMQ